MLLFSCFAFLMFFVSCAHCEVIASHPDGRETLNRNLWSGPTNQAVLAGQRSLLNMDCFTEPGLPAGATRVQWWEYGTRNASGNLISDATQLLLAHPKHDKYVLSVNALTGQHRLSFKSNTITMDDGTAYRCNDLYGDPSSQASLGAQLVVIKENPQISTTLNKTVVLEGDYYTIEALIEFAASRPIMPLMTWTGPSPFITVSSSTDTKLWSGMSFFVNRSMESKPFHLLVNFTSAGFGGPGMADNVPSWEYRYTSLAMTVKWGPKNLYVTPSQPRYEVGTVVTCVADANPEANYVWQATGGPVTGRVWRSPHFKISEDMVGENTMKCTAWNAIEGKRYSSELIVTVNVVKEQSILVQQHFGGVTFFNRSWVEFKSEFGDVTSNYWIGNDRLHELTRNGQYKLRVELQAWKDSQWYWVEYQTFKVHNESTQYQLEIGGYSGTAGDGLSYVNGMKFSTRDRDNDLYSGNCVQDLAFGDNGGFWYKSCFNAALNTPMSVYRRFMWYTLPPAPGLSECQLLASRMKLVPK